MLTHEFRPAYGEGVMRGYTDADLAAYTYMRAERPYGYQSPNQPGINSPAATTYRARFAQVLAHRQEIPVPIYDADEPRVEQTDAWSCSVASTTWLLRSLGISAQYPAGMEEKMLSAGLVSVADGLLLGNGQALGAWLRDEWGLPAMVYSPTTWAQVMAAAGNGPVLIGGAAWNHWSGVRCPDGDDSLWLANPADGWKGVSQIMSRAQFDALGPFSMIHVPVAGEEDMARIAELEARVAELDSLIGVLKDDGRICREKIEEALSYRFLRQGARDALQYGALPAAQTIERGGE
jgi:hypothetical protein